VRALDAKDGAFGTPPPERRSGLFDHDMMTMNMKQVSVSEFKAKGLAFFDEVATNGEVIVITKRGTPIAQVVPIEPPRSLRGSGRQLVSDEEFIAPIDVRWDALEQ
jgi:prevent-host-death family protein